MSKIEKAIKQLELVKEEYENLVFVERLAGNVVKEANNKGVVTGLVIALSALHYLRCEP